MNRGGTIRFFDPQIEMAHGAGGKATRRLVEGLLVPSFETLHDLADAAIVEMNGARMAFTTDAFVVRPLRFPGGSIGTLAVNGTINDLSVSGAAPMGMLISVIMEAGLPSPVLEEEVTAIATAAREGNIRIVGGDTKVVEHGKADGMYLTSTGFGLVDQRVRLSPRLVKPGDRILLSGPIGDHGIAVLLARGDLDLEAPGLRSDTRPLWPLVDRLIEAAGRSIRWMRDPTRGGVATSLAELAIDADVGVHLFENCIPVRDEVRGACELLGLDVLHIANEGQFIAVVAPEAADAAVAALREAGSESAMIVGEIRETPRGSVVAETAYGARLVDMLVGDPLPRIC